MRLLVHLCNQRLLTYHIDHMWPMSKKVKNLIPKKKLLVQNIIVEDYGWPRTSKSVPKEKKILSKK